MLCSLLVRVLIFCLVILSLYYVLKYNLKKTVWCRIQTCLVGKTAIVTGANAGIGYETALDFAKRGARVVLACRDEEKAYEARRKIIAETGNENVLVKIINLASFQSVRAFAQDINKTQDRLDILVNNAGAAGITDRKSKDGNVLLMQINYFSPFLLTHLLSGLLKKSAPSRVINVSSKAAKYAKFKLNQLNEYPGMHHVYANSKLCNIYFTMELAKKLEGSGVTTYSIHPGVVNTEIFRRLKGNWLYEFTKDRLFKTSEEGAQTMIFTSVAKGIEKYNGEHFENCEPVKRYVTAENPSDILQELWEKTIEIVRLKPEETVL